MRLLADENILSASIRRLSEVGHEVIAIYFTLPAPFLPLARKLTRLD